MVTRKGLFSDLLLGCHRVISVSALSALGEKWLISGSYDRKMCVWNLDNTQLASVSRFGRPLHMCVGMAGGGKGSQRSYTVHRRRRRVLCVRILCDASLGQDLDSRYSRKTETVENPKPQNPRTQRNRVARSSIGSDSHPLESSRLPQ